MQQSIRAKASLKQWKNNGGEISCAGCEVRIPEYMDFFQSEAIRNARRWIKRKLTGSDKSADSISTLHHSAKRLRRVVTSALVPVEIDEEEYKHHVLS